MSQELKPEACPFSGALDQARNVGHHETAPDPAVDHPEVRVQRGEGIVSDLGTRSGEGADQRRLAGVRQSQQAHVRDQLELERERAAFSGLAGPETARCAVGTRLEVNIAVAALTPLGDFQRLPDLDQIPEQLSGVGIADAGSGGHRNQQILAAATGTVPTRSGLAMRGLESALNAEVRESIEARGRAQPHAATGAAIATIRSAARDEFLAPEARAAAAAVAGLNLNQGLVDELH